MKSTKTLLFNVFFKAKYRIIYDCKYNNKCSFFTAKFKKKRNSMQSLKGSMSTPSFAANDH